MNGKTSTSIQAFIQAFFFALVVALVANPQMVLAIVPAKYVAIVTAVIGAMAVALHQHGVNRDPQGNVIPPPPK